MLLPLPPPLSDLSGGEVEVNYAALATECLLIVESLPYLFSYRAWPTNPSRRSFEFHSRILTVHKTSNNSSSTSPTSTKTNPKAEPWRRGRSNFILTRFLFLRSFAPPLLVVLAVQQPPLTESRSVRLSLVCAPYSGFFGPPRPVRTHRRGAGVFVGYFAAAATSNQYTEARRSSRSKQ